MVVFYCLFLHSYALYPFEPCTASPPQGEPDPGPYPGPKGAASARVVGRCYVAVDREGRWKLTCQFTFYDVRAWMQDSSARCFEHLRNLGNIPVAAERASDILRYWDLDYAPGADLRGPGEGRIHRHADGKTVDTADIKLGVFVQHLLKARETGTRKPDSYALGGIAPRPTEGEGEPRSHPPGTKPPLNRYVSERQAGEILDTLGYEVMTPE